MKNLSDFSLRKLIILIRDALVTKQDKITSSNKLDYNLLDNTPTIPTQLSQLSTDATHRVVSDTEKSTWSGKQDKIDEANKLPYSYISGTPTIPDAVTESTVTGWGFTKNTGTYSKPTNGIPKTDLESSVQTSLGKADTSVQTSQLGVNNGVATLGDDGKIISSQLPSYVDDVLEYDSKSVFPASGEAGKIYVAKDDNKTYRWGGSAYVEISQSLALGETSSTAYRGDRGKTAYDHSQITSGNPHSVSKSDVGLGNVDNTSDANKPISTATQSALDGKQDVIDDLDDIRSGAEAGTNAYPKTGGDLDGDIVLAAGKNIKFSDNNPGGGELTSPNYVVTYKNNNASQGITYTSINNLSAKLGFSKGRLGEYIADSRVDSCNLANKTGFYYVANNDASRPSGVGSGNNTDYHLIAIIYSVNGSGGVSWGSQLAQDFRSTRQWHRNCNNGTWSAWIEEPTTTSINNQIDAKVTTRLSEYTSNNRVASCDLATKSGFYYIGRDDTSRPTGVGDETANDYHLIAIIHSVVNSTTVQWGSQIAQDFRSNRQWHRNCNDGVWSEWVEEQPKLVSGTNIKTINGESVLGSGDIEIQGASFPTIEIPADAIFEWWDGTYAQLTLEQCQTIMNNMSNFYVFVEGITPVPLLLILSAYSGEFPRYTITDSAKNLITIDFVYDGTTGDDYVGYLKLNSESYKAFYDGDGAPLERAGLTYSSQINLSEYILIDRFPFMAWENAQDVDRTSPLKNITCNYYTSGEVYDDISFLDGKTVTYYLIERNDSFEQDTSHIYKYRGYVDNKVITITLKVGQGEYATTEQSFEIADSSIPQITIATTQFISENEVQLTDEQYGILTSNTFATIDASAVGMGVFGVQCGTGFVGEKYAQIVTAMWSSPDIDHGNIYVFEFSDDKVMTIMEGSFPTTSGTETMINNALTDVEYISNKKTTLTGNESSDTYYPTTKAVYDALASYYKKTETYTQAEVNALVSAIPKFAIEVVTALPETNISPTTIYLLLSSSSSEGDMYDEYIYVNSNWEKLGSQTIDLTDYATKDYVDNKVEEKLPSGFDYTNVKENYTSTTTYWSTTASASYPSFSMANGDAIELKISNIPTNSQGLIFACGCIPLTGWGSSYQINIWANDDEDSNGTGIIINYIQPDGYGSTHIVENITSATIHISSNGVKVNGTTYYTSASWSVDSRAINAMIDAGGMVLFGQPNGYGGNLTGFTFDYVAVLKSKIVQLASEEYVQNYVTEHGKDVVYVPYSSTASTSTVTTITNALNSNKSVILNVNNQAYAPLVRQDATNYYFLSGNFQGSSTKSLYWYYINKSTGVFGSDEQALELSSNKKTTITGNESSTTYYPTTKAVVDYVASHSGSGLPEVTTADAGKFLRVSSLGTWAVESVASAEDNTF